MAKNQTLELSILIGGHVDNSLTQAVKSANTQLSSMANGASKLAANIAKVTVGIASGITAGLVDATKEAVAFESEMLDVTKYVGGLTDANGKVKTDAYAEMSKDILDLSTQIPYTAKELTRLAAAAGQSGKSMDDLISGGFLKDVAEMGTAMDISADQAGDWAAKWEVAFNINHDQVMELADEINCLGAHCLQWALILVKWQHPSAGCIRTFLWVQKLQMHSLRLLNSWDLLRNSLQRICKKTPRQH